MYSTDKNFSYDYEAEESVNTLPNQQQKLRVQLDKKNRGGKQATLITGFTGSADDLEILGKKLKTFCGTGGSAKDNEIIVQGDQRDKIIKYLLDNGYSQTKKTGG